jgi:hypothetical protein
MELKGSELDMIVKPIEENSLLLLHSGPFFLFLPFNSWIEIQFGVCPLY